MTRVDRRVAVVCLASLFSGASALIFETLWFAQAGLTFGNSVWATSLVLAGFMAGLAIGNGAVAFAGSRIRRPFEWYLAAEVAIGASGAALTFLFPILTPAFVFVFRPFLDQPVLLNGLRFIGPFALMLAPTTAMGATLPLLVKMLCAWDPIFGRTLGRLYACNTLGAVTGVFIGQIVLIRWLGIHGSALVAATLNVAAAGLVAWLIGQGTPAVSSSVVEPIETAPALSATAWRILAAAFLSGAILLSLEVIWFRFLSQFVIGSTLAFGFMLVAVLGGIASGGWFAGTLVGRDRDRPRFAGLIALACGIATVAIYATFHVGMPPEFWTHDWNQILAWSLRLMFPVSMLSGILFTWLGDLAHQHLVNEVRTTGLLTLANTTGAMLGAITGGFLLLPMVGVERSMFVLAAAYGVVALCIGGPSGHSGESGWRRLHWSAVVLLFAAVLGLFPFGLMNSLYSKIPTRRYEADGAVTVASREGLTETIHYLRKDFEGSPLYYRLVTNGFSMSATVGTANRYMKLYTYWPMAVHPNLRRALMISYGVGSTAKSLTDTRSLETIDIVDTSHDVLEMNRLVYPSPEDFPLNDPRVTVHVEDGRYFLLTTPRRFDLITGEPPPPRVAQTVSLYTREYFQLVHDRLADHGITTYWLPVHQLLVSDMLAIIRAFCDVFDDCSLWGGSAYDWMLVGTRGAVGPVSEEHFRKQWDDPVVGPELRALGFEVPEQLGALFMSDASTLRRAVATTLPLTDDYPQRLVPVFSNLSGDRVKTFTDWMDPGQARTRFEESALVQRLWPAAVRRDTLPWFDIQAVINRGLTAAPFVITGAMYGNEPALDDLPTIHQLLTTTSLHTLPLWLLGSSDAHQKIIDKRVREGHDSAGIQYHLGILEMARRNYPAAVAHLRLAQAQRPDDVQVALRLIYALCLAGEIEAAQREADDFNDRGDLLKDSKSWQFLTATYHLFEADGSGRHVVH